MTLIIFTRCYRSRVSSIRIHLQPSCSKRQHYCLLSKATILDLKQMVLNLFNIIKGNEDPSRVNDGQLPMKVESIQMDINRLRVPRGSHPKVSDTPMQIDENSVFTAVNVCLQSDDSVCNFECATGTYDTYDKMMETQVLNSQHMVSVSLKLVTS